MRELIWLHAIIIMVRLESLSFECEVGGVLD
jgi:hypothetical protein